MQDRNGLWRKYAAAVLLVVTAGGCKSEQPVAVPVTGAPALRSHKPGQLQMLPVEEVRDVDARAWKRVRVEGRQISSDESASAQVLQHDRAIVFGSPNKLVDEHGKALGDVADYMDFQFPFPADDRWAVIRLEDDEYALLDVRTGKRETVAVSNRAEAIEGRRVSVATLGERVWWIARQEDDGPGTAWLARVEPGRATTATPIEVAAQPGKLLGYLHETDSAVFQTGNEECAVLVIEGTTSRCVEWDDSTPVIMGRRLISLHNWAARTVALDGSGSTPLPLGDCEPYVHGVHVPSGRAFVDCKLGSKFGVIGSDNSVFLAPLPQVKVGQWTMKHPNWVEPLGRYFDYASHGAPIVGSLIVVDVAAAAQLKLPYGQITVGERFAILESWNTHLVDLDARTVEPLEAIDCDHDLTVRHLGHDRFLFQCLEFDPSSVEGKTFACGNAEARARHHFQHAQLLVDPSRGSMFDVPESSIVSVVDHAAFARPIAGHVQDELPGLWAYTLP